MSATVCPKGEIPWVHVFNEAGNERYLITSTRMRDHYFLYEIKGEKLERVAKARTPTSFDSKMKL